MPTTSKAAASADRIAEIARLAGTDPTEAKMLAAKAKADGLRAPIIHHLEGLKLKDDGDFEAAIVELGLGLDLAPKDARIMTTVGFCLIELGRRQEAAQVFGAAMAADPSYAEASFGYGWAAERLGALPSARSAFERAVGLDPAHADALAGISGLAVRRRDWVEAREFAARALAIDPAQTDALTHLARVEIGEERFEAAIVRITALIDHPALKPEARADARLLLGDALDGAGRYAEAFEAYAAGKAELRALHAGQFAGAGVRSALEAAKAILVEFETTPTEAWVSRVSAPSSAGEREHAFLAGFPRSGTTLLEQVLASHPDVAAAGELPLLVEAEVEFLTRAGGVARLADIVSDLLEPYRDSYWRRARQFGAQPAGKVFVDKNPLANVRLPLIHKVFPGAKVIFAMRDPRDVVLSCLRRSFTMNPATFEFTSLAAAAAYYDVVMTATQTYFERLDVRVHRLRYEALVSEFDSSVRGLCGFLGLPWTEDLRHFADSAAERAIATPSATQVGRGLYEGGEGQWRHYDFAMGEVMPVLAPWIEKFGYPAT